MTGSLEVTTGGDQNREWKHNLCYYKLWHPMLGPLLTTSNVKPLMADHRRLLPMPVIPTNTTQVLVRLIGQALIKISKPITGNFH